MNHIVKAVLKMQYNAGDNFSSIPAEQKEKAALHEAGHLVAAEAIKKGSVGMASILGSTSGNTGGFVHLCEDLDRRPHHVMVGLAGKAAEEMYCGGRCAGGCQRDLKKAAEMIREGISESCTMGLGMLDVTDRNFEESSENYLARNEAVTVAELERLMLKVRGILIDNRALLEEVRDALVQKGTLLYSDIQKIEDECGLVEAPEV